MIQIFSTQQAFAALKNDGSVVTWGNADYGGDSSPYDASSHPGGIRSGDIASGVTQIFSTEKAFAALKNDGSVVTWGNDDLGGDSSSVSSDLTNIIGFANNLTDDKRLI